MMRPQAGSDDGLSCPTNIQYMPTLKPITAATVTDFLMSDDWTCPRNGWKMPYEAACLNALRFYLTLDSSVR
jgi:hypothetical protein